LLLDEARGILDQVERIKAGVQSRARGESGCIHVGFACATCFQPLVPGIIRAYRERYPSVLVSPEQSNTPLLVAGLRSGEIDVAFVRPPLSDGEGLTIEPLVEESMVIVLPEWHPRAGDRSMPLAALAVLFATGLLIASRVNKLPMILAFLGTFYLVLTTSAFAGQAARVAGLFRTPDLHAALYFAFFILTDPPTSPTRTRDQIVCGALVGLASYATFELTGVVYYLLAGVLVGNVWETLRRVRMRRARVTAPPRVLRPTRA